MTYQESVGFLYSLGNEVQTAKLGLERIVRLLEELGNPQRACRFIHVAGTNGKGSTCAMIETGLRAAGIRTGLYTSPHLIEPTERIQVEGRPISQEEFARAFQHVHETAERMLKGGRLDMHPTYFESVTAMGFLIFRDRAVDTVVLEVGLGGRLDATNVVMPAITVITRIDYDHQAFLGHSIEEIAAEKAGILKPGVPAVFAPQGPEAGRVLESRARELGVTFTSTADQHLEELDLTARGSRFVINGRMIECPLAGEHQVENAVVAAKALELLGFDPMGIARTHWPARLELVSDHPEIILDGAHNAGGARALAGYLRRFYEDRSIWLIYGVMRDKPVTSMLDLLFPLADRVILTAAQNTRAMPPQEILDAYSGSADITITSNVSEAIDLAREAGPGVTVVIAGSLFVAGEARALLVQ